MTDNLTVTRTVRSLADLSSIDLAVAHDLWVGDGWTHAGTLPLKPGSFLLRLRHASGIFPAVTARAMWTGAMFVAVQPVVADIDDAALRRACVALFERFHDNAGQWDLTAWRRDEAPPAAT